MSMDGIAAGLLLQATMNGQSHDQVYKLFKDLQGERDAPIPEVIELVESWKGKKCKIKYTSHIGEVVGPNTSDRFSENRFIVDKVFKLSDHNTLVSKRFRVLKERSLFTFCGKRNHM